MNTLQIQSLARWAQMHQITQNATPSQITSATTKWSKTIRQETETSDTTHTSSHQHSLNWNRNISCRCTWRFHEYICRSLRTSNKRKAHNSFLLFLPLHQKVWKFSGLKVSSSQLVLSHECQLTGRFIYLQKTGGESSCTDTWLTCSSVFLKTYTYYKLCQFISNWIWMQNAYVTGFLLHLPQKTC